MKCVLEIKYDKTSQDMAKVISKIQGLLKGLRGGYKIYENPTKIEVLK